MFDRIPLRHRLAESFDSAGVRIVTSVGGLRRIEGKRTAESEFVTWLGKKSSSPETKRLIARLPAQATG